MTDLKLSIKEKVILISVMGIPLLLLFGWIFFNSITDKRTGKEVYLDMMIDKKCEGIVDSIYRQEMNHNVLALKTKDCIFEVEPEWEKKFEIGDSISKRKGELYLKYYRNDRLVEVLNYEDLNRK
ncbi:hypothetical protein [Flavobacterium sp. 140616W15]|uniref:hypothetical protein n=1 Tax=Flavobacterium sp. 140616W15 TaxID=2478552 RepID=UPI000F0C15C6|nr:hypothetical protein [Flavobacterium sp. 140616W15]AYN03767.1 hypothetical protein EAG11_05930 [Flavobacterium sp. 140616W15]